LRDAIQIEFDHRLGEHLRARRLFYRHRSWFAKADRVVAVLLALFGVTLIALAGLRWWTAIWLVIAPIEWFNLLSIEPLVVRYQFRRSPKFLAPTSLSFSREQIHYRTGSIDSTLRWDLFDGLLEDEELFLLVYRAPRSYAVIPRRAFASPAEQSDFRELARSALAASAAA
jgi:hypothetical protein